ncbi:hypothetical protein [Singulisphaera acidiphila]|uniref:hypothetical protein n=1 Tax=Singulisphaera acidiphila TaxID=466153 RepID=UPI0003026F41|nr:hypothetical protein [Singulisphaera acidiphila]
MSAATGSVRVVTDAVTGKTRFVIDLGSLGGDRIYAVWAGYADLVFRDLMFLQHSLPVVAVV